MAKSKDHEQLTPSQAAYATTMIAADKIAPIIVGARSELHELQLPPAAIDKLVEAQQALFAFQRILEDESMV